MSHLRAQPQHEESIQASVQLLQGQEVLVPRQGAEAPLGGARCLECHLQSHPQCGQRSKLH